MLHRFHSEVGAQQVRPVGDDAVIGHQDGVERAHERHQRLGELGSSRSAVAGQRDASQRQHNLGNEGLVEREARCGVSRGRGRVGVDHPIHVRAALVDEQVHGNFAGDVAAARDLLALVIHHHEVVRLHHSLADRRGR